MKDYMTSYPIRILQVSAGNTFSGGVESFIMNIYRNIDKSKIQFDFLTPSKTTFGEYKDEIEALGGHIYELGIIYNKYTRFFQLLYKLPFFLKHINYKYKIIHINTGSITTQVSMNLLGKLCKIPIRIAHSHSAGYDNNFIFKILQNLSKLIIEYCATDYFTCSEKASNRLFTDRLINEKKVKQINNGIDLNKFKFNNVIRKRIREEFSLKNKFVIGHIGSFLPVKNHLFLLEIYMNIIKNKKDACLFLIGNGVNEQVIKDKVKQLEIENRVIFAGKITNVYEIINAFDLLIMPSLYEGFPVTLIEAQANGLPCFISDVITDEVLLTPLIKKIPLSFSADIWAREIMSKYTPRTLEENILYKNLEEYDVGRTTQVLTDFYIKKYNETIEDK